MSLTKLGLYALLLESAAWTQLLLGAGGNGPFLVYILVHGAAAAMLALLLWLLLPQRWKEPKQAMLGLFFAVVFAVPVLGLLPILAGVVILPRLGETERRADFDAVVLPALDPHQRREKSVRQSGVRGFLGNAEAPVGARLKALVALQAVPAKISSPLLRDLLTDPTEDLRLLAFGMLDREERKLNRSIHQEMARLAEAKEESVRADAVHRLAGLYWELVYQNLAQGDLRQHALAESLRYTRQALAADARDAGLHLLHGRLLHQLGQSVDAHNAYARALEAGMPASRVLPYLAELAYDAGDYGLVRGLMGQLAGWQSQGASSPVIDFWATQSS